MWVWDQSDGLLYHNAEKICRGYSGLDLGKNNPAMEEAVGIGPIPKGHWVMTGIANSLQTGSATIALAPCVGTQTFGRSAFRIHGDSIKSPGRASHGCIILPRVIRELIWNSNDHSLQVVE